MEKEVYEDILRILERTIEILREREDKDVFELKDLSDHTLHDASIYQDLDSVQIATIVFALYKLFDRKIVVSDVMYARICSEFEAAFSMLSSRDFGRYNEHIQNLFTLVRKIDDSGASHYLEQVIDKARVTKGGKLFEHGLGIKRAAEIMGIMEWELMGYVGKTQAVERQKSAGVGAAQRVKLALQLFGVK